jgi:hypothetical protein
MFVEGVGPSTHSRSRFPLHPSLWAVDGEEIEEEGELPRPLAEREEESFRPIQVQGKPLSETIIEERR